MNELIQEIMLNINKKGIQKDCKKILKKCSMKSAKDTGFITELAVWLTVIDYDTELAMDGLEFKSYRNVIDALTDIGVTTEAQVLIELESDMSQDGIDSCYSKLALNNDYEAFWDKIYLYADKNMKQ